MSRCESYRELVLARLPAELSARRIWQDLVESGATVGYDSARRFAQRLGRAWALPFYRMERGPGEEARVDFGTGAPVITADHPSAGARKRRKTYVFRIVLSHSRKAYSEATFTQTTEDFFRCLENAFAHFGGVPKTLVIDNLKAAVAHPDWFDPELTPKVQSFCRHHSTVILPTKPYMPRHKAGVESGGKHAGEQGPRWQRLSSARGGRTVVRPIGCGSSPIRTPMAQPGGRWSQGRSVFHNTRELQGGCGRGQRNHARH